MTPAVTALLTIDGVHFPLDANPVSVGIADGIEELQALRSSVDALVNGDARTMPFEVLSRNGFHAQEVTLTPVDPTRALGRTDQLAETHRAMAELLRCVHGAGGFVERTLMIPRPVLLELVSQMR